MQLQYLSSDPVQDARIRSRGEKDSPSLGIPAQIITQSISAFLHKHGRWLPILSTGVDHVVMLTDVSIRYLEQTLVTSNSIEGKRRFGVWKLVLHANVVKTST